MSGPTIGNWNKFDANVFKSISGVPDENTQRLEEAGKGGALGSRVADVKAGHLHASTVKKFFLGLLTFGIYNICHGISAKNQRATTAALKEGVSNVHGALSFLSTAVQRDIQKRGFGSNMDNFGMGFAQKAPELDAHSQEDRDFLAKANCKLVLVPENSDPVFPSGEFVRTKMGGVEVDIGLCGGGRAKVRIKDGEGRGKDAVIDLPNVEEALYALEKDIVRDTDVFGGDMVEKMLTRYDRRLELEKTSNGANIIGAPVRQSIKNRQTELSLVILMTRYGMSPERFNYLDRDMAKQLAIQATKGNIAGGPELDAHYDKIVSQRHLVDCDMNSLYAKLDEAGDAIDNKIHLAPAAPQAKPGEGRPTEAQKGVHDFAADLILGEDLSEYDKDIGKSGYLDGTRLRNIFAKHHDTIKSLLDARAEKPDETPAALKSLDPAMQNAVVKLLDSLAGQKAKDINCVGKDNDFFLKRLVKDIAEHYEAMCADNPQLIQKAMVVCASRPIAYQVYEEFRNIRPAWFEAKGFHDDGRVSDKEREKLKDMPFINLVGTQGNNDTEAMYEAFGDKKHREELAEQFKLEHSNFRVAIVVDMWITGFDVPNLCVMYNDKPLQKQSLIQTISRVNRKYQVSKDVKKEYGLIVDYIGIYENMREAMKKYGGDADATSADEVETAKAIFDAELSALKEMMEGCDMGDFFGADPLKRLLALQRGAEYVLAMPKVEGEKVSFQTRFKGHLKRLKQAYDICHPAGVLAKNEIEWAQMLLAIGAFIRKATDSEHDTASMNRHVEQMVKEAIACTGVESLLDTSKDAELIFSEDFEERLKEVKLPNTKFQMLVKMMKRAIREYSMTNKIAAKRFDDMLDEIVKEYNNRDSNVFANKVAGEVHEAVMKEVESKVEGLSEKIIELFRKLKTDKEKFKALGITFEEQAFYDILVAVRDDNKFEYADKKCLELAKKIKALIDDTAIYADWKNNANLRNQLNVDIIDLLYANGYPPAWHEKVYDRVMEQVDNFKRYEDGEGEAVVRRMIANQEVLGGALGERALPGDGYAREDGEGDYAMAATGERRYG